MATALTRGQDVHLPEPGRRASMAHGVHLAGLALAVVVGAVHFVGIRSAEAVAAVPELHRIALVGDVAQHAAPLASLDLPRPLTRELEVVALLIDGVRAAGVDEEPVVDAGDQVLHRSPRSEEHTSELQSQSN